MIKRKLGSKGQIVIPKIVRDFLGIGPEDDVIMEFIKEGVLIRPKEDPSKFVEDFCSINSGRLKEKIDLKKLIEKEVEGRFVLH
ncbi:AbrB/MazE/SpoVT family DNA-binding domain-containing protein [Candidatus Bathyarchaeota archaeon]|nr:AbrB/MazE/SpoVT family DNA-binding domain-containing protein [Candidatus Bathyarchaeota archaeon]